MMYSSTSSYTWIVHFNGICSRPPTYLISTQMALVPKALGVFDRTFFSSGDITPLLVSCQLHFAIANNDSSQILMPLPSSYALTPFLHHRVGVTQILNI